jgi:hypothetical protein
LFHYTPNPVQDTSIGIGLTVRSAKPRALTPYFFVKAALFELLGFGTWVYHRGDTRNLANQAREMIVPDIARTGITGDMV